MLYKNFFTLHTYIMLVSYRLRNLVNQNVTSKFLHCVLNSCSHFYSFEFIEVVIRAQHLGSALVMGHRCRIGTLFTGSSFAVDLLMTIPQPLFVLPTSSKTKRFVRVSMLCFLPSLLIVPVPTKPFTFSGYLPHHQATVSILPFTASEVNFKDS